ncbi:Fe-S cluster assembly ATPase SufC [SAR202 cluster bacterium AD-804-J14_MRT_500m]|nr:Fe-S cluster assembly ATPase SufC [SAR202 cluster bacterium AD-804-J14_MRT_500m]
MLEVKNLCASVGGTAILKGLDLSLPTGQVHAIMGPNGSGKSTFANALAGKPGYDITSGQISFFGNDLLAMPPEERARAGVFLSFQHPVEVPGVRLDQFLRAGYNAISKSRGSEELDPIKFDRMLQQKTKIVEMDASMTRRAVNEGFSGGEKKRSEILQMAVLEPKLAILDEPDSGLDVDALRIVAQGINQLRTKDTSLLLVTHYQRILDYVVPDVVHILVDGKIVHSGGKELALEIDARGYDQYEEPRQTSGHSVN